MKDEDRVDSIDPVVRALRQAEETIAKGPNAFAWKDHSLHCIKAEASEGVVRIEEVDDLDFGSGDFTITATRDSCPPITIYINKSFRCPVCDHEGEYQINLEGPPNQKMYCPKCLEGFLAECPIMELVEEQI